MKLKRKNIERRPSHPGEILKALWLDELGITQTEFAERLSRSTGGRIKISTTQ